jgi:hypothetical protein
MLIKILDTWFEPTGCMVTSRSFEGFDGVKIVGAGDWVIWLKNQTPDEVAAEINKQLKDIK